MAFHTPGNPGQGHSNIPSGIPESRLDRDRLERGTARVARRLGDPIPPQSRPARSYGDPVVARGVGASYSSIGATTAIPVVGVPMAAGQVISKLLSPSKGHAQRLARMAPLFQLAADQTNEGNAILDGLDGQLIGWANALASADPNQVLPNTSSVLNKIKPLADESVRVRAEFSETADAITAGRGSKVPAATSLAAAKKLQGVVGSSGIPPLVGAVVEAAAQRQRDRDAADQQQRDRDVAAQQQGADRQTVDQARSRALGLMQRGDFDGALAALSSQAVQTAAGRIGRDLSEDVGAISSAKTQAAAGKQSQSDKSVVDRARSSALALMRQGNYDGALAAVQSTNVQDAASRLGYDLSPDIEAVTGAQAQAQRGEETRTAATQAQRECAERGGQWTGTYCDMTEARASASRTAAEAKQQAALDAANAKVDAALSQAQALSAAGSYRAALAALAGASRAAQVADRGDELGVLAAQIQDEKEGAAAPPPAAPTPSAPERPSWMDAPPSWMQAPPASQGPDPQVACIQAGGQWDGERCEMPPPSWIAQLLPSLFGPSQPQAAPQGPTYAPVSQGPTQQQLSAMALLQAFGGAQGQALVEAIGPSMAPQGQISPGGEGVPDGTPCVLGSGRSRTSGVYQRGQCQTVAAPGRLLYGAASGGESF